MGRTKRKFRLNDLYSRLNRYCVTLKWRADPAVESVADIARVPFFVSSLLCGYCNPPPPAMSVAVEATHAEIATLLFQVLEDGRNIYPDVFAALLSGNLLNTLYADQAEQAAVQGIGDFGEDQVLYPDQYRKVQTDCGVFPNIASFKLSNVYGKLRYGISDFGQVSKDLEFACVRISNIPDAPILIEWLESSAALLTNLNGKNADSDDELCEFPKDRDMITRYVRDTGYLSGQWAMIGTRVHRKCYAYTIASGVPSLPANSRGDDFNHQAFCNMPIGAQKELTPDLVVPESGHILKF